ncbi:MAG: VWA domain-containing protein, partial [Rhodococcus sp.]|nr:VWA domain-containing protein [Rhodococcus sp. (in: high G+C Gram-positive bacteria)]
EARPQVLAVELPAEAGEWTQWIGHPETVPPVAFALADPVGESLSFYPFAAFSPEFVALQWAHQNSVPVQCIDLSAAVPRAGLTAAASSPVVGAAIEDRVGAESSVDSWDVLVESRGCGAGAEEIRRAALAVGFARRADHDVADMQTELREAAMREGLRSCEGQAVAAVIGAFHAPALTTDLLADPEQQRADADLLARHPAVATPVGSLVPYGSAELDSRSGYPAGIADPAWQQTVLESGGSPAALRAAVIATLTDIGVAIRRRKQPCGTPEIAEAARMALDLASLRGLPAPGRRELLEAMTTVFAQGDVLGRGRVVAAAAQDVLVGAARGTVAPAAPRTGLADDVDRRLAQTKLPSDKAELRLEPLRSDLDAAREVLLHQFAAAAISYGQPVAGIGPGGARTVGNRWEVGVSSSTHASIAAAARFGVTVPQVAAARLRHGLVGSEQGQSCQTVLRVLRQALYGALGALVRDLVEQVRRTFPHEAALTELTGAVALCEEVLAGQFAGALTPGIKGLYDEIATVRTELTGPIVREIEGMAGATDIEDARVLAEAYRILSRSSGDGRLRLRRNITGFANGTSSSLIRGAARALLVADNAGSEAGTDAITALSADVAQLIGSGDRPRIVGYVQGLLAAVPHLLLTDPEALAAFDTVITELTDAGFVARLPALRGAFDGADPEARDRLLAEIERTTSTAGRRSHVDPELVAGWAADDQQTFARLRALGLADAAFTPGVRWQLILGRRRDAQPEARALCRSLDRLYGAPSTRVEDQLGLGGGAGSERSYPSVREWSDDLLELFGADVREDVLAQAADRGDAGAALTLSPDQMRPSVELLTTMLALSGGLPEARLAQLRPLVRRCVEELTKRLATQLRPALRGLRTARPTRRNTRLLDPRRTIAANLKHVYRDDDGQHRIVAAQPVFAQRAVRQPDWHIIIVVDVSGSMEASTVYAALVAAVLAGVPALSVTFLAFSTEIVDLSEQVEDPLALLTEISVGGGTSIWLGVAAAAARVKVPKRTLLVMITDFEENGPAAPLLAGISSLAESGVQMLGCAALDDTGVARYHVATAQAVAAAGMPVSAVSPTRLAEWVAETVNGSA